MHRGPARKGKRGKAPRRNSVTAAQFREIRLSAGLSRHEAAALVGVSLRTVGHWETGAARPAFAAFKLLRVYRHGDLIDPRWQGFQIVRGLLVTPEGHSFRPDEMLWQSLLVRRSRALSDLLAERDAREREVAAPAATCADFATLAEQPAEAPGRRPVAPAVHPWVWSNAQPAGPHGFTFDIPALNGDFSPLGAVDREGDRARCPVGPGSNTGLKFAQNGPGVFA